MLLNDGPDIIDVRVDSPRLIWSGRIQLGFQIDGDGLVLVAVDQFQHFFESCYSGTWVNLS